MIKNIRVILLLDFFLWEKFPRFVVLLKKKGFAFRDKADSVLYVVLILFRIYFFSSFERY